MADTFRKIIDEDLELLLPNIQTKTLLIWGEQDTETPLSDAQTMKWKISHSELITYPLGTHFVFQEFPQEVFESIQKFSHSL